MDGDDWVAGLFSVIDRKDVKAFVAYLTDDVCFRFGNAEPIRGRDAVRDAVGGFFSAIAAIQHALGNVWHCGEHTLCRGTVTYTRLDGSRLTVPFANVFDVREGTVSQYDIYVDISRLFAA